MTPEHGRGAGHDAAAIPLANGGTEYRTAEGKQSGVRPERDIMPERSEFTGFLSYFVVSFSP